MMNYIYLFYFLYFIGLLSLCFNRFHILMLLLSLEYIILILFFIMIFFLNIFEFEYFFSMMFLSFTVCEGVLGLSLLIKMVRFNGNDYYQVLNFL